MAKIWREELDLKRHRDFVSGHQDAGGVPIDPHASDGWVYFVRECSFTFQFVTIDQIRECRDYFGARLHSARRRSGITLEHHWQRWFERLPPGLVADPKRTRILEALERALATFGRAEAG
jgi:hypothetical protein